jgi:hypothetical protein
MLFVTPLADARQVLFTDAAADSPEMHERRVSFALGLGVSLCPAEPFGRSLKPGHLGPDSHRHNFYLLSDQRSAFSFQQED